MMAAVHSSKIFRLARIGGFDACIKKELSVLSLFESSRLSVKSPKTGFSKYLGSAPFSTKSDGSSTLKISTGAFGIPKSEKVPVKGKNCSPLKCGEDSFSIAENGNEIVLGVADGVGSWSSCGIDPSVFSQTIMYHVSEITQSPSEEFKSGPDRTKALIHEAYSRLLEDFKSGRKKPLGSSTVCVVLISKETGNLKFGNHGDSGFVILSPAADSSAGSAAAQYRIKFKSESQQHSFNYPYQLANVPKGEYFRDEKHLTASDVTLNKNNSVQAGDIVLVYTDGVSDNIHDCDLEKLVTDSYSANSSDSEIAYKIAQDVAFKARELSEKAEGESPFAMEANKISRRKYQGGKEDDITIVAAIISSK